MNLKLSIKMLLPFAETARNLNLTFEEVPVTKESKLTVSFLQSAAAVGYQSVVVKVALVANVAPLLLKIGVGFHVRPQSVEISTNNCSFVPAVLLL